MGLQYPTVGGSTDVWGQALNVLLGQFGGGIENHNHSSGQGNPIPSSALAIDADVSWTQHAITSMLALQFAEVAPSAVTGYSDALFVSSADHNLYFRNNSGTNVQVTSGNTLNISIVGGIGGDYSSVNALLSYNDASRNYWLQQEGTPRPWAGLQTGDIQLFQKAASIANSVTLKSPNSLAASYTVTWPAAVPAAQAIVQIGTTGTLVASNTLASNQNLTLTGSGYVQRAKQFATQVPVWAGGTIKAVGTAATDLAGSSLAGVSIAASSTIIIPLGASSSEWRLQSVDVVVEARTIGSGLTLLLETADNVSGGYDAITGASTAAPVVGPNILTPSSPSTLSGPLFLQVASSTGASVNITAIYVSWDIP